MAKTIRYVTGLPKSTTTEERDFSKFREKSGISEENTDVWLYSGPLKKEDFDTLQNICCSDQFYELNRNKKGFLERLSCAIKGEKPLTQTTYIGKIGQPHETKHITELQEVTKVSEEFF